MVRAHAKLVFTANKTTRPRHMAERGGDSCSSAAEIICARPNGPLLTARPIFAKLGLVRNNEETKGGMSSALRIMTATPKIDCHGID